MMIKGAALFQTGVLFLNSRYGKWRFIQKEAGGGEATILDVGCGNNSPQKTKMIWPKCYYCGIDVMDYNQKDAPNDYADEYTIVKPQEFANAIGQYAGRADIVISSHNIEHCDDPEKVCVEMCKALKKDGKLYMRFPSEDSVNFPSRKGTLNFFDDTTHKQCPDFENIKRILLDNEMKIEFEQKSYRPLLLRTIGRFNEKKSATRGEVLFGTWAYWGFESVIVAKKM